MVRKLGAAGKASIEPLSSLLSIEKSSRLVSRASDGSGPLSLLRLTLMLVSCSNDEMFGNAP